MPSLPRIRGSRARRGDVVARPQASLSELEAAGLTWINVDRIDPATAQDMAERFGWHPLDVEDVLSKRQRPKVDEYSDYVFAVLHFGLRQGDPAAERRGARPFPRRRLPGHDPQRRAAADLAAVQAAARGRGVPRAALLEGLRDACCTRSSTTSSTTASRFLDKIAHKLDAVEDDIFEGRSRDAVRDISNVKQEIISFRRIIKPQRATSVSSSARSSASCRRTSSSTSTTSSTRRSGSGTCSTTTRRSSRRSRRRTSR